MGVGTVVIRRRVGLLKSDLLTPADLPAVLDADGGFKVHVQNPTSTSIPANLRKEDGHGSAESTRSWGYVTEVDDDGNVLVARRPAAESRPVVLSNEDLAKLEAIRAAIAALPAPPSTVTANQGTAGAQSWKVLDDNSALIATRLLNIYTSLQGQREVATSVWTDNSGAYYVRRDIIDESSGTPVITVTFTDEAGAAATPGAGLRPVGGSDRELTQVLYVATAGGTGYSTGDILARIAILDASVSPPTATAVWFNLTTGAIISTPTGGTYEDAGELVGIKGVDGTGIATDANPLPVRDSPLKTSLEARLGPLGRKPNTGSAPVVISDEQEALLRQDATYAAGVASSAAVVIAAFEVGSQGHFTVTGTTSGAWVNTSNGQAGLVAVEGSNDPGPGGGVPPTTGWGALRMENANGQSTTAMRGGGSFSGIITTRWLRVRCLSYQAGSMDLNLVVFPRNRQLFRQNIKDVDGIASMEVTPGTGMAHFVQRTPLHVGGNFDVGPLNAALWTLTATGSATATFVAGNGLKLATGTTANSTIRIESVRKANLLAGAANVADILAATEAAAVAGCVKRWGLYDDDSGVFFEQYHDGTASRVTIKTRKNGVDTAGGALNGVNNIGDNAFGVPLVNLYELAVDPLFVKAKQSGVLVHLFAGLFPTLFSRFDLPLRFEVINSGGTASNNTLHLLNAGVQRLGQPDTIRADESFDDDDVLASTAAVIQGRRFDNTFDQVPLPEHDRDLQNEQVAPLTNGAPVVFTVDTGTDRILSVGHGLVSGNMVHVTTTGTLPSPLVVGGSTTGHYYVVNPTADDFQVSLTSPFGFPGPVVVNIADVGTGVHSYSKAGEFIGAFTRIGDVDHTEVLYASLTPMGGVLKVWSGDGVHGLNRAVADGVLNSTTTVTAASGFFTRYDKGSRITGTGIPAGTRIASVQSPTSITLSQPATATASGVALALASDYSPSALAVTVLNGYYVYYDINEGRNMAPFYLLRIYNGATNQSAFPGYIHLNWMMKTPYQGSFGLLTAQLNNLSRALLVRSVNASTQPDGDIVNARSDGEAFFTSSLLSAGQSVSAISTGLGLPRETASGAFDTDGYNTVEIGIFSDVPGTVQVYYCDNVDSPTPTFYNGPTIEYGPDDVGRLENFPIPVGLDGFKAIFTNNPTTGQAQFLFAIQLRTTAVGPPKTTLDSAIDDDEDVVLSKSAIMAPDGTGGNQGTIGRDGGGSALNVHVKNIDDGIVLKPPVVGPVTAQVVLSSVEQRIDLPDVTGGLGARFLEVRNVGDFHAFLKESSPVTEVNSKPIFIAGNALYALPPGGALYGICEDTGGATQSNNRFGTVAGGTGTSPSSALASDDVRSSQAAAGQTVYAEGFTFSLSPTFTAISKLELVHEGRKQSGQFETVSQVEARTGTTTGSGSVTSASLTGGTNALLVAYVARASSNPVTSLVGGGLVWTQLVANLVSGSGRRLDIWYAFGNSASGSVTANLTSSDRANIVVVRYANADPSGPIQAFGTTTGSGTAVVGPTLASTNKGYSVLGVVHGENSATPGVGYTELADIDNGTTDTVVENKALVATGTEAATLTLGSSGPWAAAAFTIAPKAANDPTAVLSYLYNAVPGATSSLITIANTSDGAQAVDITPDFLSLVPADVALIRVISTAAAVGSAAIQADALYLRVTETSGATTRVAVSQQAVA